MIMGMTFNNSQFTVLRTLVLLFLQSYIPLFRSLQILMYGWVFLSEVFFFYLCC